MLDGLESSHERGGVSVGQRRADDGACSDPRPTSVLTLAAPRGGFGAADLLDRDSLLGFSTCLPGSRVGRSALVRSDRRIATRRVWRALQTLRPRRCGNDVPRADPRGFSASKVARTRLYGFDEPERLGDNVLHAKRLEDGAHRAARDDAGALPWPSAARTLPAPQRPFTS